MALLEPDANLKGETMRTQEQVLTAVLIHVGEDRGPGSGHIFDFWSLAHDSEEAVRAEMQRRCPAGIGIFTPAQIDRGDAGVSAQRQWRRDAAKNLGVANLVTS